ncbi:acetyl-CoA carboxylase carboxyltransferase subunit alpha/beta [Actinomadura sp. HBU206391]|uniref:acetyl-CoA carboxylase carboxyltransferase subunit alpha/beta n=1 Tax=Actinomadura sp. HBU206391 TaxID=2731692 RepID=UPI0021C6FC04|nr:acetyl-CoA carboxylase carboxyltransferase subunit alpha/beta [Actinomadura sp. HBU206391]
MEQLADPGSIRLLDLPRGAVPDVLRFVDTMPYPQRLAEARARTGLDAAVLCARITIEGAPVVVAVMDFSFMGGSLGAVAGEAVARAAEAALADRIPLLAVTASGGARMQEGAISLMQMAKTSVAWAKLDEAALLTVSLITDPTYGGVAASFATLSDVIIGETGARLGFAGRRVIEQTIRQKLPPEFQTVEFVLERGFVDMVVPRRSLREVLAKLLRAGSQRTRGREWDRVRDVLADPTVRIPELLPVEEPWQQVRRARDLTRPTTLDYIALAFDDFQELHGDRVSGECSAMVAGIAQLDGRPVALIGQQKGHTLAQLSERNFGMPTPAGYRKAARVMRLAAKLGMPVVTLVDTPGAFPGERAEEQGQASAIAENLRLMASLPVPVVSFVTGEGGSGGALGIALANRVLIWEHAVYSVISPEGCASILWKDPRMGATAAAALGLGSRDLLRLGVVDGVLPEPAGGLAADPVLAADQLRAALLASFAELAGMTASQLVEDRRRRFARFGCSKATRAAEALAEVGTLERLVR